MNYIGKTFDEFCEMICSQCVCSSDLCAPLERNCRLLGDMEELSKVCNKADELKETLMHLANDENYCFDNPCDDF